VMLFIGVYPKIVLDRIEPTSVGAVRWVESVEIDQAGVPGGLRAEIQPEFRPTEGVVAAGGGRGAQEASADARAFAPQGQGAVP
jgi:hypothetical protein